MSASLSIIPAAKMLLWGASIICIGIDSFPIFPIDVVHRPVSSIMLVCLSLLFLMTGRCHKITQLLLVLCLALMIHLIFMSSVLFQQYQHVPKATVTIILFFLQTLALFTICSEGLQVGSQRFLRRLGQFSAAGLSFILAASILQLLAKMSIVEPSLSEQVTGLFSYRSTGRIQGVSGEPASFVRSLGLFVVFVYYFYFGALRYLLLASAVAMFLLSGSTYGYVAAVLFLSFLLLAAPIKVRGSIKIGVATLCIVFSLSLLFGAHFDSYTQGKLSRLAMMISEPNQETIRTVLQADGSMFQRIMNPIIAFRAAPTSFFLGSGLDTYRYLYAEIVNNHYAFALAFETVASAVIGNQYITPKSLLARIFVELGFAMFLLLLAYLLWLLKGARKLWPVSQAPLVLISVVCIFALTVDSLISPILLVPLIFAHTFMNHLNRVSHEKPRIIKG